MRHITKNEVISRAAGRTNIAYSPELSTTHNLSPTYGSIDHSWIENVLQNVVPKRVSNSCIDNSAPTLQYARDKFGDVTDDPSFVGNSIKWPVTQRWR